MKEFTRILGIALIFGSNWAGANPITLFDNGSFSGFQEPSRATNCAEFDNDGICTSRFTVYEISSSKTSLSLQESSGTKQNKSQRITWARCLRLVAESHRKIRYFIHFP